jgi:hypothetical protein
MAKVSCLPRTFAILASLAEAAPLSTGAPSSMSSSSRAAPLRADEVIALDMVGVLGTKPHAGPVVEGPEPGV